MKKKQVLITGADGFIGSHLTEALIHAGCNVRAFVYYNSLFEKQTKTNFGYGKYIDKTNMIYNCNLDNFQSNCFMIPVYIVCRCQS